MMAGLTRTPSGRIRRIPSDLMKRVRCAYPGCELAVIPSNFARHWKFKHTDLPQPPIDSLTVVRGDNSSDSGDVSWPSIYKNEPSLKVGGAVPSPNTTPSPTSQISSGMNLLAPPTLRVDGKERKRARQRNYICPECQRPLIGSNFGRHWASKHPHLIQPSLVDLEMEALSGEEEGPDPLFISPAASSVGPAKTVVKKRKVVCRECEMPMISSNFSRHWASRHPHLEMPALSELEVIDVEVEASSPPSKKPLPIHHPPVHHHAMPPITIPYPEDEDDEEMEPADEEFEDLEEIEDEEEELSSSSKGHHRAHNVEDDFEEEDLEEVTVEPLTYTNGSSQQVQQVQSHSSAPSAVNYGGKRHKKVFCPECNMPMLCNNFRRHFHRRHGEMLHRMPSIHSLKLVPDEEYEMAQINKVVPPYNSSGPPPIKDRTHAYPPPPEAVQHAAAATPLHLNNNSMSSSPVRVKRKIVCSECGMAMIGSNFGRHWASKHAHLPQPALQDLVYADSAESGEAETVVCEPLFFGPDSEDEEEGLVPETTTTHFCDFDACSFASSDKVSLHHHRIKYGHFKTNSSLNGNSGMLAAAMYPSSSAGGKVKKVWKKKVVCPQCNLQTITSNFSRHWMAKHGHLPTPELRDLQVITIDDPGFQGNTAAPSSGPSSHEAEEIVVDPTIAGMMNHGAPAVYEEDFDEDYEEEDFEEDDEFVECVQELEEDEARLPSVDEDNNGARLPSTDTDEEGGNIDIDEVKLEPEEEEYECDVEDEVRLLSEDNNEARLRSTDTDEEGGNIDIDEVKLEPEEEEPSSSPPPPAKSSPPLKYSNNKINCNFDINSLLEDDDDDGEDQDESGEFASVEVN